jgi:hypothetical protein
VEYLVVGVCGVFGPGSFPGEGVGGYPHLFFTPVGWIDPARGVERARRVKEDQAGLRSQSSLSNIFPITKKQQQPIPAPPPPNTLPVCMLLARQLSRAHPAGESVETDGSESGCRRPALKASRHYGLCVAQSVSSIPQSDTAALRPVRRFTQAD